MRRLLYILLLSASAFAQSFNGGIASGVIAASSPTSFVTTTCAALGSNCIRAYDFTNAADIVTRSNLGTSTCGSDGRCLQDSVTVPPGELDGMKILWPNNLGTGVEPGGLHLGFSDNNSKYIGPLGDTTGGTAVLGNDVWVGYWYYITSNEYTPSNWLPSSGEGFKMHILTGGDIAGHAASDCSSFEQVGQNQDLWQQEFNYHSCGIKDSNWLGTSAYEGFRVEASGSTTVRENGLGCWFNGSTWSGNCFFYPSATWVYYQFHLKIGSWYLNNSGNYHRDCSVALYAHSGNTMRLLNSIPDYDCTRDITSDGGIALDYGKIYLTSYYTGVDHPLTNMTFRYGGVLISKVPFRPYGFTVPLFATNFHAYAASNTSVVLSWTDNATDETGYKVQRCTGDRNECGKTATSSFVDLASGTCGGTLAANSTGCTDNTATGGVTYSYRAYPVNAAGSGAPTDIWPNVPLPASDLTATAGALQVSLAWTNNLSATDLANANTQQEAYRCAGNSTTCGGPQLNTGTFVKITAGTCAAPLAASATSCVDTDPSLVAANSYTYRIGVKNGAGYWTNWKYYQTDYSGKATAAPTAAVLFSPSLGWNTLASTQLSSFPPNYAALTYVGSGQGCTSNAGGIPNAWSSAAYAADKHWFMIFGGGHNDYGGNEVYGVNLGVATPVMARLTDPTSPGNCGGNTALTTLPTTGTSPGQTTSCSGLTCKPNSRHTYGGEQYITGGRLLITGGGPTFVTGGFLNPPDLWELNISGLSFSSVTSSASAAWTSYTPGTNWNDSFNGAISGRDNSTSDIYVADASNLFKYDATNHNWTNLGTLSIATNNGRVGSVATTNTISGHKEFYVVGNSSGSDTIVRYDLTTNTSATATGTGCSALSNAYPGIDFDTNYVTVDAHTGAFIIFVLQTAAVYALDPANNKCTLITGLSGTAPTTVAGNGVIGNWRFMPEIGPSGSFITCPALNTTGSVQNCSVLRLQ